MADVGHEIKAAKGSRATMAAGDQDRIFKVVRDEALASDVEASIRTTLDSPQFMSSNESSVSGLFERSLGLASRDIVEHPTGQVFRRLIEFGPLEPDGKAAPADPGTFISDAQLGYCIEFIYSVMIIRFKGELAELLALGPTLALLNRLTEERRVDPRAVLYWGPSIEQRLLRKVRGSWIERLGAFTQGADGVFATPAPAGGRMKVHAVVEVKSMIRKSRALAQLARHVRRLDGGLKINGVEFEPDALDVDNQPIKVLVRPSNWKIKRQYRVEKTTKNRVIKIASPVKAPVEDLTEQLAPDLWSIRLRWSEESLLRAAFSMSLWYVATIGESLYGADPVVDGCLPSTRSRDRMCHWLYFAMRRDLSLRQLRRAE